MSRQQFSRKLRYMCLLAMFIAIELVFKFSGLGNIAVGPLVMSFMTVPIAVGAILLGPAAGAALGCAWGLTSLYDAITGAGGLTNALFAVNPVLTVILCVGTRTLMGFCVGWIYKALKKVDRTRIISYFISALSAALLNTVFFMGFIILFFYNSEPVQNLVVTKGALNPFMFVALLVGVQGLIEAGVCMIVGGGVAKGVDTALNRKNH